MIVVSYVLFIMKKKMLYGLLKMKKVLQNNKKWKILFKKL